jgi:aminotransferase in exopolysaccharide biosynthesis
MFQKFDKILSVIRNRYGKEGFIPLHVPNFDGNEKKYLNECIDSTFVSSVGPFVTKFEEMMVEITGAKFAVAVMNGTAALHMCMIVAGVKRDDEVITQALTFVATTNAITYIGAHPVFLDVDRESLGLSPAALDRFLSENTYQDANKQCINKKTGRRIKACIPMHTFGLPLKIRELSEICKRYNILLIEDAAESLGSSIDGKHTGTFGEIAAFSFNGNKTVTSGGGGAIITDNETWAKLAKHLTTTAKTPHSWDFYHDQVGYNYRMPNINAALACAQLERLPEFIDNKRKTAQYYAQALAEINVTFIKEPVGTSSNYWLNAICLENREERDAFLSYANEHQVMVRPIWILMNKLPAFSNCQCDSLENSTWLEDRIVNIPSSYIK